MSSNDSQVLDAGELSAALCFAVPVMLFLVGAMSGLLDFAERPPRAALSCRLTECL